MQRNVISVPEDVMRAISSNSRGAHFTTLEAKQRLEEEEAYRKERLTFSSSRRLLRRCTESFNNAFRDAENQQQLFRLLFAQLARQENGVFDQPTVHDDTKRKEREKMRKETMEALRTIL